ncbi:polysaccharide deacetylase family protein [Granulicella arctica]|uniref:Peptidoglycan/xylan/chitin deacetylase (PgdA/CDA1 family) n=1 Tax=Granulicella arctica TaxID=940613 RepID=A0A7Y9PJK4_9BACT|nr:polysaccharide deacetylase family protein [Granulicella arctica]NYF81109.1 peptidoglycan/xylan/chitin deacetylase (PgdA/CDA1 family) [Granulicella arctica]
MNTLLKPWLVCVMTVLAISSTHSLHAQTTSRKIAITVDDLPGMSAMAMDAAQVTEMNKKLLASLQAEKAPAIGFVNEERLYKSGEADARIAVLNSWLDAGFDLGNHTFSHTSLNHVELKDWEDDVVQGESVTRILLNRHHKTLRYLRHPYLDAGPDLATRRQAEAFLAARGYRVAPVTMDSFDWYFADLYGNSRQHGDIAAQQKIVQAWLAYTDDVFTHDEQKSRKLMGYEPKQVLLLHDTWLEADHITDLLALLRRRGYQFISLDDALTDPAYAQPDDYISDVGASWIDHWAVTQGHPESPEEKPALPKWIQEKHRALDADDSQ